MHGRSLRPEQAATTRRGQGPGTATRFRTSLAPSLFVPFAILLSVLVAVPSAAAVELTALTGSLSPAPGLRGNSVSGERMRVQVRSLDEIRWQNVVRQKIDIGCGAASLATILTYYFDFPTTEEEMFQPLLTQALKGTGPDVRKVGVSLKHIRDVAAKGGLAAAAFRVHARNLHKIRIPSIARVTINGYDHFVVFKQARGGRVYVADPAFGNTSYRLKAFEKIWSGVLMGFMRRTGDRPLDHLLLVGENDERVIHTDEIWRLADVDDVGRPAVLNQFTVFSKFPFIQPQVSGLRSVFPAILFTQTEF